MVDKDYCMSSYLAFRYIEDVNKDFYPDTKHKNFSPMPEGARTAVQTAEEIGNSIQTQIGMFSKMRKGLMLSGGMDSAIVASYLPGADAYTFRYLGGVYQSDETRRAEYYAKQYGLTLHYVDIDWTIVEEHIDELMRAKGAPVHSIEPQILAAANQAKDDGIEMMFVGESSDLVFGGMDQLLSKDWGFDEFMHRYIFLQPDEVLMHSVSMQYVFERYRMGNKIDFLSFMDDVFSIESSGSYYNAFGVANLPYYDPYAHMKMAEKLDLVRVRGGEPKYLIRELMHLRYPDIPVPDKVPMPRPVDEYFKNWAGPNRPEFRKEINLSRLSGNQKWQLWCLERFLNLYENVE